MEDVDPRHRLIQRLETVFNRAEGRLTIDSGERSRWHKAGQPELERRLAELEHSDVAFDLPAGLKTRLLGAFTGTERTLQNWRGSRAALLAAWERASPGPGDRVGVTLAHTTGYELAAIRVQRGQGGTAAVGIDLESEKRPVSDAVTDRIRHAQDELSGAPAIGLWTLKEAVFKAAGHGRFREFSIRLEMPIEALWHGYAHGYGQKFEVALVRACGYVAAVALAGPR